MILLPKSVLIKKFLDNFNHIDTHPTCKPISLMRYLVKMVTPPDGTVLDPFCGSGSTLRAAMEEGFNSIGIEKDDSYIKNIEYRMEHVSPPQLQIASLFD